MGGVTYATEDIGGVQAQIVKPAFGGDGVATVVQASAPLPVNLSSSSGNQAPTTGTLSAAGGSVTAAIGSMGNGTIVLYGGTYTQLTLAFEGSIDNTNWFPIDATRADGTGIDLLATYTTTGTRAWNYVAPGYQYVRVRAVSITQTAAPTVSITSGPFLVDYSPAVAPIDGVRATYTSSIVGLSNAVASDLFMVTGSATKLVRISRVEVSATASATTAASVSLQKRSTAGTPSASTSAVTVGSLDSTDPATSATSAAYTAAGTPGTTASILRSTKMTIMTSTAAAQPVAWDFGGRPSKSPVLRGTAERLVIVTNTAVATGNWNITVEYTEE